MQETYYYSPSKNQFLPKSLSDDYKSAETWPHDAIAVDDETYQTYGANPAPVGKIMGPGDNGLPVWVDQPPPSSDELKAQAESRKSWLLSIAAEKVAPLQDAVDLGMETEDEQSSLLAWKKYRVLVSRVDTSTAPDIKWPEPPISI